MRLDVFLFEKGLTASRSSAKALIEAGKVNVGGIPALKPSLDVGEDAEVSISDLPKYVGRGGYKLEAALDAFGIDVTNCFAVDIGASTGGFTDCLLKRGAAHIVAVDAGEGQLAESLRNDARVESREKTNARNLKADDFSLLPDLAVMDVSFISQTLIFPAITSFLPEGKCLISLLKPQFEAGREALGKKGIVKNAKDRERAILRVLDAAEASGLGAKGLILSPITGGDGNTEYLALFIKGGKRSVDAGRVRDLAQRMPASDKRS